MLDHRLKRRILEAAEQDRYSAFVRGLIVGGLLAGLGASLVTYWAFSRG